MDHSAIQPFSVLYCMIRPFASNTALFDEKNRPSLPNVFARYLRLKGNVALTGTLRAALVPYDAASPEFEEAVELLDQYAGTYPTKGALRVKAYPFPVLFFSWLGRSGGGRGLRVEGERANENVRHALSAG